MRDLEEEIKDEQAMKEARLAALDLQLLEKMQLVADEQSTLDELKDKSINMQRRLDEEALKAGQVDATPKDTKSALKDRLREKLELTNKKNEANQAGIGANTQTPTRGGHPEP